MLDIQLFLGDLSVRSTVRFFTGFFSEPRDSCFSEGVLNSETRRCFDDEQENSARL